MITRTLEKKLKEAVGRYPVVTVTGPRQSGKTTLVKSVFKHFEYISLELPDERSFALEDPRGFLNQFEGPVVLDEIQRAPDLFSYIQVIVDNHPDKAGLFILTGSQNFLLLQSISQSLAGRCAVFHLLPFSLSELMGRTPISLETLGMAVTKRSAPSGRSLFESLFTGFYPRIHDKHMPPNEWLSGYYQTYLERDVRAVLNIGDIESFSRFIRLCAGRCGQVLSLSGLASDCGISHTTAKRWISVLESSFVITLLRPYHKNFGKRLIKSPKLYFLDSGLLCYLLQIKSPQEISHRSERGAIFETYVVSEILKNFVHRGNQSGLYFWRDSAGHEIDVIIDLGARRIPLEIKSGQTVVSDFFKNLVYWRDLMRDQDAPAALIYGGDRSSMRQAAAVYPWFVL